MDLSKLTNSDRIVAISGIVLFIAYFLPWFAEGGGDVKGSHFFLNGTIPFLIAIARAALAVIAAAEIVAVVRVVKIAMLCHPNSPS